MVVVEADSSMMQALIECDSLGKAHIRELLNYKAGQRLKPPTVIIRDNILTATAQTDSLEVKIQWLERELEHYKIKSQVSAEVKIIEVNRLSWWQTLFYWVGIAATIIITIIIAFKLIRNGKK